MVEQYSQPIGPSKQIGNVYHSPTGNQSRRNPNNPFSGWSSGGGSSGGKYAGSGGSSEDTARRLAAEKAAEEQRKREEQARIKAANLAKLLKEKQARDRKANISRGKISGQLGGKPRPVYTSNPNFVSKVPGTVTVYYKDAKTTGKTSVEGLDVPKDINIRGKYRKKGGGVVRGSDIIQFERVDTPFTTEEISPTQQSSVRGSSLTGSGGGLKPTISSFPGGTETKDMSKDVGNIFLQPTLMEKDTGEFITKDGKKIPTTKLVYFDPFGESLGGGATRSTERTATTEEQAYFKEQTSQLQASEVTRPTFSKIKETKPYSILDARKQDILQAPKQISGAVSSGVSQGLLFAEKQTGYNLPTSLKEFKEERDKAVNILESQGRTKSANILGITSGFTLGLVEDVQKHPLKEAGLFALGGGIGKGSKILVKFGGKLGAKLGFKTGAKYTTYGLLGGGVALTGAYGLDVGSRTILAPTYTKKGEILGGAGAELLFLGAGAKTYSYGSRRYGLYKEVKTYAKKLPPEKQVEFYKAFEEAKGLRGIKPKTKELDLSRLSLIEDNPQAQAVLKKYFAGRKDLIIGGSISQQSQFETGISGTKRPGDIDAYVRRLFGFREGAKGQKYARDIASQLRGEGLKASARKGKVSINKEKFIEFHAYKEYLKPNIEQVTPFYFRAEKGITRTPEGINILRLDIQAPRKVVGFYLEPVMSGKHRLKDLPAYETIKESLLRTRGAKEQTSSKALFEFTYTKNLLAEKPPQIMSFGIVESKGLNIGRQFKLGVETKPKGRVSRGGYYSSYRSYTPTPTIYAPKPTSSYQPYPIKNVLGYTPTRPKKKKPAYKPKKPISYRPFLHAPTPYTPYRPTKPSKDPPYIFTPIITPTTTPVTTPPLIKKFKWGGAKKRKQVRAKQPTRYQPSFTGSILNIRGKPGKYAGGLSIRPLLPESDLLKRKKKKKVKRR